MEPSLFASFLSALKRTEGQELLTRNQDCFEVKPSKISGAGNGLFAIKDLPRGTRINSVQAGNINDAAALNNIDFFSAETTKYCLDQCKQEMKDKRYKYDAEKKYCVFKVKTQDGLDVEILVCNENGGDCDAIVWPDKIIWQEKFLKRIKIYETVSLEKCNAEYLFDVDPTPPEPPKSFRFGTILTRDVKAGEEILRHYYPEQWIQIFLLPKFEDVLGGADFYWIRDLVMYLVGDNWCRAFIFELNKS